jgi:hypothetical protein
MLGLLFAIGCGTSAPPPPPPPEVAPMADEAVEVEAQPQETPSQNHPPHIDTIEITPQGATDAADLLLDLRVSDADNDILSITRRWFVNGRELPTETGQTLGKERFRKGDRIRVQVGVNDGQASTAATTPDFVILDSPPIITNRATELSRIDGFRVKATDLDGDPLTFKLEGAPKNLTIGTTDGVLHYAASLEDPGGDFKVVIRVDDGDAGFSTWTFPLHVEPGGKAKAAAEDAAKKAGGEATEKAP